LIRASLSRPPSAPSDAMTEANPPQAAPF